MKITCWNVNGIRAAYKKGLFDFFKQDDADIFCLQETKAHPDQLVDSVTCPTGYTSYWGSAERKGYSGTAIFSKNTIDVHPLGIKEFDSEGRVLVAHLDTCTLINAYFPNSQEGGKRLGYKLEFCNAMLEYCNTLTKDTPVILCGDYNIAHTAIDLARPKENEESPGYLPEERAWMDKFLSAGYTDTFRQFCSEPHQYTWWSYRSNARTNNIGWRIDYFCVNDAFSNNIQSSIILPDVLGSDHCPISIITNDSIK